MKINKDDNKNIFIMPIKEVDAASNVSMFAKEYYSEWLKANEEKQQMPVKIIETNMSIDIYGNIRDHQSRVIEFDSWKEYCKIYIDYDSKMYPKEVKSLTSLKGKSVPKNAKIENLEYDDFHLKCDIIKFNGIKDIKLAYLI